MPQDMFFARTGGGKTSAEQDYVFLGSPQKQCASRFGDNTKGWRGNNFTFFAANVPLDFVEVPTLLRSREAQPQT